MKNQYVTQCKHTMPDLVYHLRFYLSTSTKCTKDVSQQITKVLNLSYNNFKSQKLVSLESKM